MYSYISFRNACSISDTLSNSVVVTGGYYTRTKVSRYGLTGSFYFHHLGDLPSLNEGRRDHACGAYLRDDGTQVLITSLITG